METSMDNAPAEVKLHRSMMYKQLPAGAVGALTHSEKVPSVVRVHVRM